MILGSPTALAIYQDISVEGEDYACTLGMPPYIFVVPRAKLGFIFAAKFRHQWCPWAILISFSGFSNLLGFLVMILADLVRILAHKSLDTLQHLLRDGPEMAIRSEVGINWNRFPGEVLAKALPGHWGYPPPLINASQLHLGREGESL